MLPVLRVSSKGVRSFSAYTVKKKKWAGGQHKPLKRLDSGKRIQAFFL
jgi:hypothetical protein